MGQQADNQGSPAYTVLIAAVAALAGLLFGFDWAVISGAVPFLEAHFELSSTQLGFAVSSALLGCIAGVLVAGLVSDRFGRIRPLQFSAVLFVVSAALTAIAGSLEVFVLARVLGGVAIGLSSPIAPVYIAEVAPEKHRGALVTLYQLAITFGIVVAYLCDYLIAGLGDETWGNAYAWRWMFASEAPPALLFLLALLLVPESPRWLAKEGRGDEAEKILTHIGGEEHARSELAGIQATLGQEDPGFASLFRGGIGKALLIGVGVMIFSQITGNFAVFTYTPKLLLELGYKDSSSALLGMVMVGVINFVTTIAAVAIIDRLGRRPLLMFAPLGMSLCMGAVACLLAWQLVSPSLMLGLLLGFVFFYAIGVGPGAWLIIAEIFPNRTRARATSLCTACLWVTNFLTTLIFPPLWETSRFGTFGLFCLTSAAMAAFVYALLPETKGRSLEQIEALWHGDAAESPPNRTP